MTISNLQTPAEDKFSLPDDQKQWLAIGLITAVALAVPISLIFLAFWPQLRFLPNPWRPPVGEELRPVVAYMRQQLQPDDFIYVYYGAVPAYEIYGQGISNATADGVWFRNWPTDEKIDAIQEAGQNAPRLWLVMSHIAEGEDEELIRGLQAAGYALWDSYERQNATAVLFLRQ